MTTVFLLFGVFCTHFMRFLGYDWYFVYESIRNFPYLHRPADSTLIANTFFLFSLCTPAGLPYPVLTWLQIFLI